MEPQPPSPALSRKVMPPEPLPKGSVRCLDPHTRTMVSGAGDCGNSPGRTGVCGAHRAGRCVNPPGRGFRGLRGPVGAVRAGATGNGCAYRGLCGPVGSHRAGGCGDTPGRSGPGLRRAAGPRLTAPRRLCPQSQPDGEPLPGALEKEDARSAPSTPSTPSVCSPPSSSSSTPSAGKNVCSSCGLEILDRYLLKVSGCGGGGRRGAPGGPGSQPLLCRR